MIVHRSLSDDIVPCLQSRLHIASSSLSKYCYTLDGIIDCRIEVSSVFFGCDPVLFPAVIHRPLFSSVLASPQFQFQFQSRPKFTGARNRNRRHVWIWYWTYMALPKKSGGPRGKPKFQGGMAGKGHCHALRAAGKFRDRVTIITARDGSCFVVMSTAGPTNFLNIGHYQES